MNLKKLSDLIPLLEQGHTPEYIGEHILVPKRAKSTMDRYMKKLKDAGFVFKTNRKPQGRPKLKI